eukprot:1841397-Lingulodinium_polyedra.AAC.1
MSWRFEKYAPKCLVSGRRVLKPRESTRMVVHLGLNRALGIMETATSKSDSLIAGPKLDPRDRICGC